MFLSRQGHLSPTLTAFGPRGWLFDQPVTVGSGGITSLPMLLSHWRYFPPTLTAFGPRGGFLNKYCCGCQNLFEDVAFSSEVFSIHVDRFQASWGIFWLNITAVLSQNLFNNVAFSLEVFSIHICHSLIISTPHN